MNVTILLMSKNLYSLWPHSWSVDPAVLGGALLEEVMREKGLLSQTNGSKDTVPEETGALARALAAMINRTPEQIEAGQKWR